MLLQNPSSVLLSSLYPRVLHLYRILLLHDSIRRFAVLRPIVHGQAASLRVIFMPLVSVQRSYDVVIVDHDMDSLCPRSLFWSFGRIYVLIQ